jgi:hypothetical protein
VILEKFPVPVLKIPCSAKIIPCFVAQGILPQVIEIAPLQVAKNRTAGHIPQIYLFFSLLAGNLR